MFIKLYEIKSRWEVIRVNYLVLPTIVTNELRHAHG